MDNTDDGVMLFAKQVKEHVTCMNRRIIIDMLFGAFLCFIGIKIFELVALIETKNSLSIVSINY